jgi:hypothetical protein
MVFDLVRATNADVNTMVTKEGTAVLTALRERIAVTAATPAREDDFVGNEGWMGRKELRLDHGLLLGSLEHLFHTPLSIHRTFVSRGPEIRAAAPPPMPG